MLHYIYSRSFISVITVMVLALAAWGALPARVGARRWRWGNLALMLLVAAAILCATLFSRAEGSTGLILTPFATFTAARVQPELYREMLMNVFLFFPLGLTLSNAPAAKVALLGQNHPHNARRLRAQRGDRVRPVPLRAGACGNG